ncbi:MAG: phage holin family protein [Nitriliruptoraceae bacterium]
MRLLLRTLATAGGLWLAATLIEGIRLEPDRSPLLLVAVALLVGLANATVRPLLALLTLPFVLLTLGLGLLVVNAAALSAALWASARLDLGLTSAGFGATFLATLVLWGVGVVADAVLGRR